MPYRIRRVSAHATVADADVPASRRDVEAPEAVELTRSSRDRFVVNDVTWFREIGVADSTVPPIKATRTGRLDARSAGVRGRLTVFRENFAKELKEIAQSGSVKGLSLPLTVPRVAKRIRSRHLKLCLMGCARTSFLRLSTAQ